jgi:hypothetical protein
VNSGLEIVPFGKYKGQSVDLLLADRDYCSWLLAQSWFPQRFESTYNFIVNYGAEPQDSPEHNALQAYFLNHNVCLSLAHRLGFSTLESARQSVKGKDVPRYAERFSDFPTVQVKQKEYGPRVDGPIFESMGWDVTFSASFGISIEVDMPACACPGESREKCIRGSGDHRWSIVVHEEKNFSHGVHCSKACFYAERRDLSPLRIGSHIEILAELKPSLGDDYPSVLRQIQKYPGGGTRCVLAVNTDFRLVTYDQVRKVFASQGVHLVTLEELAPAPEFCRCAICMDLHPQSR